MARAKYPKKYKELYIKFKGVLKLALFAMLYLYPQTAVVTGISWFITWSLGRQLKNLIQQKAKNKAKIQKAVRNAGYARTSEITIPSPLLGAGMLAGAAASYFGYHNHFDSITQGTVLGMLVKVIAIPFASVIVVSDGASNLLTGHNSNIRDTYRNIAQDIAHKIETIMHQNNQSLDNEVKNNHHNHQSYEKTKELKQLHSSTKDQVNTILSGADIILGDKTHKPSSIKKKDSTADIKR